MRVSKNIRHSELRYLFIYLWGLLFIVKSWLTKVSNKCTKHVFKEVFLSNIKKKKLIFYL